MKTLSPLHLGDNPHHILQSLELELIVLRMVLYDFKISMMRIFTLFAHMLFTTVLYWTKFDSIQVSLSSYTADNAYESANESYTGLISISLIFLFIEMIYLGLEVELTLWTVLHLFLDFVACLFIAWIFLDGLAWQTYIYVFVFCRLQLSS